MFQVMQSGNQAGRQGWGALVWAKKLAELLIQGWPIDEVGQSVQFMSGVEYVRKAGVEQVGLASRFLGFWLHLESKFARN
jgi:aldehyde:ferredoxin oxidoreductase